MTLSPDVEGTREKGARYAMTVAYDGTAYRGWQVQPDAPSVQETVEEAFARLCGGARPRIHGSGRTDTGVHARGQVFHVNPARRNYTPGKWREALNGVLPGDIRILRVRQVEASFHARYDVCRKEYRYFCHSGRVMPPDLRRYRVPVSADPEAMRACAALLRGRHDFTAFSAGRGGEEEVDPVRNLEALDLVPDAGGFFLRAVADGFLYKMVRRLAGALLRVGEGGLTPQDVEGFLRRPRREALVPTAPPQGLFLWKVDYGDTHEN